MLYYTANPVPLTLDLYLTCLEYYDNISGFLVEQFTQLGSEFIDTLRTLR